VRPASSACCIKLLQHQQLTTRRHIDVISYQYSCTVE